MSILLGLVSLLASLAYGVYFCRQPPSPLKTLVKTVAVGCLALLAFVLGGPLLLVLALGLSALGDYFISRAGDNSFLAGMAAFLLAHLAYIGLFLSYGAVDRIVDRWQWALLLSLLAAGLLWLIWRGLGRFRGPVIIYTLVIACMGLSAFGLPATGGPLFMLTGACLFILSDAVLAVEKFASPQQGRAALAHAVWSFYWLAQVMILLGVLTA